MKLLSIGHSTYDITVPIKGEIKSQEKQRLIKKAECGGGPAANVAYLFGKWMTESYYMGVIGNDVYGQKIKKELESVRVDTHFVETDYQNGTSLSIVLVNETGNRTLLNINGESMASVAKNDVDFVPDAIFVDGNDYMCSKNILEKYSNAITMLDAGRVSDEIIELAKKVKYLICSKEFVEGLLNQKIDLNDKGNLVKIYQELVTRNDKSNIIVTLGENGILYNLNGSIKLMPAFKVTPIDTTGAGDIFEGSLLYALLNNYELENAIKFAKVAASLSVTKYGGRLSIPTLEEVKNEYEKN